MIEMPAHDSIYEYLLTKIYPENLQDSPLYKILMNISKYINGIEDQIAFDKLCNDENISIRESLNKKYIIDRLTESRQYIKDTQRIYTNIKKLVNDINVHDINIMNIDEFICDSFLDLYRCMLRSHIYLDNIPSYIEDYKKQIDPYWWIRELRYKARIINNIISKPTILIDEHKLWEIYIFIEMILLSPPFYKRAWGHRERKWNDVLYDKWNEVLYYFQYCIDLYLENEENEKAEELDNLE